MKKLILKLCSKALYWLATRVNCDFDKDDKNDILEIADRLALYVASLEEKAE